MSWAIWEDTGDVTDEPEPDIGDREPRTPRKPDKGGSEALPIPIEEYDDELIGISI